MKTLNVSTLSLISACVALFMPLPSPAADNVILLMLDGVRWQEVFSNARAPIFTNLWQSVAGGSAIFGDRMHGTEMTVSNRHNISLPAYQSIMAGATQGCASNECGRVSVETMQERIRRELDLPATQVATIASWDQIPNAVEHAPGATFTNAGFEDLNDGTFDPGFDAINHAQTHDRPHWEAARLDRYTWEHAMRYLTKHKPRFLFISLNDSDEWAHRGEWNQYINTLQNYDAYIKELMEKLDAMGEYGKHTTLIVTTDHGRGDGKDWMHHGPYPSSKYVWLFGRASRASKANRLSPFGFLAPSYSHIDIRPTIEAALGLAPIQCAGCGRPIRELIPDAE